MASRELRRLSRMELIDIIYQLRKDNDKLEQKLSETSSHLEEKTIVLKESGSIADAALALNGVFDAAQRAADQYLLSVKSAHENTEKQIREAKQQCAQMLAEASAKAEKIISGAETERLEKLEAADRECKKKYDQLVARANQYIREHPEIRPLFIKQQRQE